MRIAARLLGLFFILAALVALGADLAAAGDGDLQIRPLGALWYALHAGSLNLTQAVIERYIWAPLWDPVLIAVLQWPAAPVFAALGVVLFALSFLRRPAREDRISDAKPAERDPDTTPPPGP